MKNYSFLKKYQSSKIKIKSLNLGISISQKKLIHFKKYYLILVAISKDQLSLNLASEAMIDRVLYSNISISMMVKEKKSQHQQMSLLAYCSNTYQISISKWFITQAFLPIVPKRST
jgi:hypothetical protein